jgi:hypothetical protein
MKILVLILTSDSEIYNVYQQLWASYMNLDPNIRCYFYKADPTLDVPIRKIGNNIIVRMEESWSTLYKKTVEVFKYLHDTFDNYDFVLRTNMSSFYRFNKYLEACEQFPKENFCTGVVGLHDGQRFPSGCGFTVSTDVARLIAQCPIDTDLNDDVAIGKVLTTNNIPIVNTSRYNIKIGETVDDIVTDEYHFRVNTANEGGDRWDDLKTYKKLIKKYYPELP